jgi:Anti-sigma-K factor rskA/Putative zinc-finger
MMEPSDHVDDLATPYALGSLDLDEIEHVELHLEICERCRRLVEEERSVAAFLPYLAEPLPVPLQVRSQLLDRIREEADPRASIPPGQDRGNVASLFVRLGWVAAVLAAVLALVFFWNGLAMQQQVEQKETQLSVLEQRQSAVMEFVSASQGSVTNLRGTGAAPGAHGGVILDPARDAALLVVKGLTVPVAGHTYVVWLVKDNQRVNAGIIPVDDQGRGQMYITLPGPLRTLDNVVLTEETRPTATDPNGTVLMTARIGG